jgi:hypothetical protein
MGVPRLKIKIGSGYIGMRKIDHPGIRSGGYVPEAKLVCEKALGKFLPIKAMPHHINGIKTDNTNQNLIICQDQAYHMMLHRRERAFRACGHAHWMRCPHCKKYDDPKNMYVFPNNTGATHRECVRKYDKKYYKQRKNNVVQKETTTIR